MAKLDRRKKRWTSTPRFIQEKMKKVLQVLFYLVILGHLFGFLGVGHLLNEVVCRMATMFSGTISHGFGFEID